jgi:Sulfotransferase family
MARQSRQKPIFVVGSGRSGTTWIGDVIGSCAGCSPIFEPMRTDSVAEVPRWGLRSGLPGPYLRARDPHPDWATFLDALLAGGICNVWTRQDWTRVPEVLTRWPLLEKVGYRLARIPYQYRERRAHRYVIKEIRANLMLEWLERHVDARIVYLIRHPCAVVGSRMRLGLPDWEADFEEILCQSRLMGDFLEPFRPIIEQSASMLRRQAVVWCVENLVPISQAGSKDWFVSSYEEFLCEPDRMFEQLFRILGLEPTLSTERAKNRVVSSASPHFGMPKTWHAPLTEAEGEEILEICAEFGLGFYSRQSLPVRDIIGHPDRPGSARRSLGNVALQVAPEHTGSREG